MLDVSGKMFVKCKKSGVGNRIGIVGPVVADIVEGSVVVVDVFA